MRFLAIAAVGYMPHATVANPSGTSQINDTDRANARLIAASPIMLTALRSAKEALKAGIQAKYALGEIVPADEPLLVAYDEVRAAIAAAEVSQ